MAKKMKLGIFFVAGLDSSLLAFCVVHRSATDAGRHHRHRDR